MRIEIYGVKCGNSVIFEQSGTQNPSKRVTDPEVFIMFILFQIVYYIGGLVSFASTVIFLFTLDISG